MASRPKQRVLLIGWDGADWEVCQPLLEQGRMPNLKQVIEGGVSGRLQGIAPLLAPPAWTTVATGKRPFKHGVLGLREPDDEAGGTRQSSNASRQTNAIWNILAQHLLRSHVIGWPGAHPAEPISGIHVTEQYMSARVEPGRPWPAPEGSFHPPSHAAQLASLRTRPEQLDHETLNFFAPGVAATEVVSDQRLAACVRAVASTATCHAVATWAMEQLPWNFAAVCYTGLQSLSRAYLRYMSTSDHYVTQEDRRRFGSIVSAGYQFHDMMLGRLLQLAGEGTTVLLLSAYGQKTGAARPPRSGAAPEDVEALHRRSGIFVAYGEKVIAVSNPISVSPLDVAPTILSLFGLPVAADMDGRSLTELFEPLAVPPAVASWDAVDPSSNGRRAFQSPFHTPVMATITRLKDLGYVDPSEERLAAEQGQVRRRNQYNFSRSLMEAGRVEEAVAALEALTDSPPLTRREANLLIEGYFLLERFTDAERVLTQLPAGVGDGPLKPLTLGRIAFASGDYAMAIDHLQRAAGVAHRDARPLVFLGQAWLRFGDALQAQTAFEQALRIDSDNPEAAAGLSAAIGHATAD